MAEINRTESTALSRSSGRSLWRPLAEVLFAALLAIGIGGAAAALMDMPEPRANPHQTSPIEMGKMEGGAGR